jgi:hypothetical protein
LAVVIFLVLFVVIVVVVVVVVGVGFGVGPEFDVVFDRNRLSIRLFFTTEIWG